MRHNNIAEFFVIKILSFLITAQNDEKALKIPKNAKLTIFCHLWKSRFQHLLHQLYFPDVSKFYSKFNENIAVFVCQN